MLDVEFITKVRWKYLTKNKVNYLLERYCLINDVEPGSYKCDCGNIYSIDNAKNNHKLVCPGCNKLLKLNDVFLQCFPGIDLNNILEQLNFKLLEPKNISFTCLIPKDDLEYIHEIAKVKNVTPSNVIRNLIAKDKSKTKRRGFIK